MSEVRTSLHVLAPVPGLVVPMVDVPDPVFAASLVGPGVALDPSRSRHRAVAPVGGRIVKLHPHAIVVVTPDGRGVLVHLGIDSVQLKGEGFSCSPRKATTSKRARRSSSGTRQPSRLVVGHRSARWWRSTRTRATYTGRRARRRGCGGGRAVHVVMTPPAGVVFDLDGTLVLTEGRNAVVWRSFFEANGVGYDDELAHHVMGRRAQDSLVELMHLFPDRPMDELLHEVNEIDRVVPLADVLPVAGAVHLVRRLVDAGMPLALVTSAGRPHAHALLRELGLLDAFATSVTGEDVARGKPDPEGYRAACAGLGPAPALVVGFEDSRPVSSTRGQCVSKVGMAI